jgi:hypothetical protein
MTFFDFVFDLCVCLLTLVSLQQIVLLDERKLKNFQQ